MQIRIHPCLKMEYTGFGNWAAYAPPLYPRYCAWVVAHPRRTRFCGQGSAYQLEAHCLYPSRPPPHCCSCPHPRSPPPRLLI